MCEPNLIIAGIGAGMSLAQGFAAKSASDQQADNYRLQGRMALDAGNAEANQSRQASSRELGRVRALQSASGVDISSGSPADTGGRIAGNLEMDALMKMYRGRLGNWQAGVSADQAKYQGKTQLWSSVANATTTLLGGAAKGGMFDDLFKKKPAVIGGEFGL